MKAIKQVTYLVGGLSIRGTVTREESGGLQPQEVSLPAGKAGTLSTRTNDTAGTATLAADHGILENELVDIYWTGGVCYGATAGVIAGAAVPFTGATGTVLPAQTTAIVMTKQVTIDMDFVGNLVSFICASLLLRGHLDFQSSVPASIKAVELLADEPWEWFSNSGVTNPFADATVARIQASNGTTAAATVKLGGVYDSA